MSSHRAPPPTHPSRVWLGLMTVAVAGIIVPPTILAAHAVAPRVAADEHLALTPERSPEPVAHGGPLSLPSIGAVTSDPPAYLPPIPRPAQRPSAPLQTVRGSTAARPTPAAAPSATEAPSSATSVPTVTEPVQAATTEATPTATTDPTETCLPGCDDETATETTTTETTTSDPTETVSVTVSATETTEEGQ